jgi:hypothetical protein
MHESMHVFVCEKIFESVYRNVSISLLEQDIIFGLVKCQVV